MNWSKLIKIHKDFKKLKTEDRQQSFTTSVHEWTLLPYYKTKGKRKMQSPDAILASGKVNINKMGYKGLKNYQTLSHELYV